MRILLLGWYGNRNIGDEAILKVLLNLLRDHHVVVLSHDPVGTAREYKVEGIHATFYRDLSKKLTEIFRSQILIIGGGTLFQDNYRSVPEIVWATTGKLLGKKVILLAVGVNPIEKRSLRFIMKFLNLVDHISVRDAASKKILDALGIAKPSINITSDLSLLLSPPSSEDIENIFRPEGIRQDMFTIGVSLRNVSALNTSTIAITCDHLISTYGAKIVFLPFQYGPDNKVLSEVKNEMQQGRNTVLFRKSYGPEEMLGIMGSMKLLVAMRLHSLIFAAMRHVPFVALEYDPKVTSFLTELGMNEYGLPLNTSFETLQKTIDDVWSHRQQISRHLEEKIEILKRRAFEGNKLILSKFRII